MHLALSLAALLTAAPAPKSPLASAAQAAASGDCEAAVQLLSPLKSVQASDPAVAALASAATGCRERDRVAAFALTYKLVELAPRSREAVLAHVESLVAMDDKAEAVKLLDEALSKSPADAQLRARREQLGPAASAPPTVGAKAGDPCGGADQPACEAMLREALERKPPDFQKALAISQWFCDRNIAAFCDNVGLFYSQGQVPKNPAKSMAAYEKACGLGDGEGCSQFGLALLGGKRDRKAEAKALESFRKSCDLQYGQGCYNLGVALERGVGARADDEAAKAAFKRGCALDDKDACQGACDHGVGSACR